jgi:hypothetical protein
LMFKVGPVLFQQENIIKPKKTLMDIIRGYLKVNTVLLLLKTAGEAQCILKQTQIQILELFLLQVS